MTAFEQLLASVENHREESRATVGEREEQALALLRGAVRNYCEEGVGDFARVLAAVGDELEAIGDAGSLESIKLGIGLGCDRALDAMTNAVAH